MDGTIAIISFWGWMSASPHPPHLNPHLYNFPMNSSALAPFVISTLNSIYLGALPMFVGWRLHRLEQDIPVSPGERKSTYAIMACVTALQVVESLKGAYFGMEYFEKQTIFNIIGRLGTRITMNIVAEVAHILTFVVVSMRLTQLVSPITKENGKWNMEIIAGYTILASRIICPILMLGNE